MLKKLTMFLIISLFLITACSRATGKSANSKTAIINYTSHVFPDGETFWSSILYIDGEKRAEEKFLKGKKNQHYIFDGKEYIVLSVDYKFAFRSSKDETGSPLFMKEPINEDYTEEEFLGRKCKVYVIPKQGIPNREIYFWEGIVLREVIEQTYEGTTYIYDMAATDVKINVKVPKNKFKAPWGTKFVSKEEAEKEAEIILRKELNKLLR